MAQSGSELCQAEEGSLPCFSPLGWNADSGEREEGAREREKEGEGGWRQRGERGENGIGRSEVRRTMVQEVWVPGTRVPSLDFWGTKCGESGQHTLFRSRGVIPAPRGCTGPEQPKGRTCLLTADTVTVRSRSQGLLEVKSPF